MRRGLHREVVHQLGLLVIRGVPAPGETLPDETALGEQFGVSRTVLREAIKVLAAKGLVEPRPRVGTRVRPRHGWNLLDCDVLSWRFEAGPDETLLREITEIRGIIEPAAAALRPSGRRPRKRTHRRPLRAVGGSRGLRR